MDVTSVYFALVRTRMIAPTPILGRLPGLSPDQAADAIAKAIIERPRTNEPPWVFPAELASVLLAGPADRAARLWHRRFFADSRGERTRHDRRCGRHDGPGIGVVRLLSLPAPIAALRLIREVYRGGTNLYTLLAIAAARWPERTAIIDDDGALSYRELQVEDRVARSRACP